MPRILVVIDPSEKAHSALERCRSIPQSEDLLIRVCLFIENDSTNSLIKEFKEKSA